MEHYQRVAAGERLPRHAAARSIACERGEDSHARAVRLLHEREGEGDRSETDADHSLLDLKIEMADRLLDSCDLCPHHCRVNRNAGETGYCGVAAQSAVHWEGILAGEEKELVPSHEVFFSGCTMRCAFCYSHEHITRPMSGSTLTPIALAERVRLRQEQGAANLNLVGGEPTVHLAHILRTLRQANLKVPVIWNSNMYITPPAMKILDGIVDLYLGDIHFGNDDCAKRLGRIPAYMESITRSFQMAVDSGAGVIIRHLVMPGHLDCCTQSSVLWAARHFPKTLFHLMFQYVPDYRARRDPVLGRPLSIAEIDAARRIAEEAGVRLYDEDKTARFRQPWSSDPESREGIGETVDILIHGDGRVAFTRLLESLTPVASSLCRGGE